MVSSTYEEMASLGYYIYLNIIMVESISDLVSILLHLNIN